jgi:predicted PurR-regulated permease PerM
MAEQYTEHNNYVSRALEVSIHVGLLILLAVTCLLILLPFLPLIVWGIIIAIAVYPGYRRAQRLLGGRSGWAAVACTLLLLALLILPAVLLTGSLVDGIQSLATRLKEGTPLIPPPPSRIETWPIVGVPLKNVWDLASKNLSALLQNFAPQIKAVVPKLLLATAGVGLAVLQWILSILVSGVLLANAASGAKVAHSLASRLFGDKGPEFEDVAGATIRSVTTGIIGVAFIQSIFAAVGFLVVGLPGAGLWGVVFLFAAVLQLGIVVLAPAVIYVFAVASTTKAVIFLVWCLIVGTMDNVLKPLLLGRGVAVPMVVVFLGAVGGFMAMGTIGLFVGAIVLSIGYKLFLAWLGGTVQVRPEMSERSAASAAD